MIAYRITGTFYPGVPWEDCFSPSGPSVTIVTKDEPNADEIPDGETFIFNNGPDDDGWFNATVKELTGETAKAILAKINKVTPEEISIEEQGVCAAI